MTIRSMEFQIPETIDAELVPGNRLLSSVLLAGSLSLPHLEPYLVRTMNAAKAQVSDAALAEDMRRFSAQEGHHYRTHKRLNDAVRLSGLGRLTAFEVSLDTDYRRFSETKSPRFNLAYAEGFEAMTAAVGLVLLDHDVLPTGSVAGDVWTWHFLEELEHRTVAFDAYHHVAGGYLYRLAVGAWAQYHYVSWVLRVAREMRCTSTLWSTEREGPTSGRPPSTWRLLRRLVPLLLRVHGPRYTPHAIAFTPELQAVADSYTARAVSTR